MLEEACPFRPWRQRAQAPTQADIGMCPARRWRQPVDCIDQLASAGRQAQHWHRTIQVWPSDAAEAIPRLPWYPRAPRTIGIVPRDLVVVSGAAIGGAGVQIQLTTAAADASLAAGKIEEGVARAIIVVLRAIDGRETLAASWARVIGAGIWIIDAGRIHRRLAKA